MNSAEHKQKSRQPQEFPENFQETIYEDAKPEIPMIIAKKSS